MDIVTDEKHKIDFPSLLCDNVQQIQRNHLIVGSLPKSGEKPVADPNLGEPAKAVGQANSNRSKASNCSRQQAHPVPSERIALQPPRVRGSPLTLQNL